MTETNQKNIKKIALFFGLLTLILISILAFIVINLRKIKIADLQYSSQNNQEIVKDVMVKFDDLNLVLKEKAETVDKVRPVEIGLTVEKTALENAINEKRKFSFQNIKSIFSNDRNVKLPIGIDSKKAQNYVNNKFANGTVEFRDPTVEYNKESNQFVIKDGQAGKHINIVTVLKKHDFKFNQQNTLNVQYENTEPARKNETLTRIKNELNHKIGLRFNLNYNGALMYFADPWDIAEWISVGMDGKANDFVVKYDAAKVKDFLNNVVGKYVKSNPINGKDLVDKDGKFIQVLQTGRKGFGNIKNIDNLAEQIMNATKDGKNIDINLELEEIPNTNEKVVLDGNKWVEVNLSRQTASLHVGDKVIQTFVISSGLTNITPTGTFHVWYKNPRQTMTGGSKADGTYYSLPNVTWVTYFNGDISFHTAYWHNNFGRPMSHGCINMRAADAKVVYDFAPIGTTVVVHY